MKFIRLCLGLIAFAALAAAGGGSLDGAALAVAGGAPLSSYVVSSSGGGGGGDAATVGAPLMAEDASFVQFARDVWPQLGRATE